MTRLEPTAWDAQASYEATFIENLVLEVRLGVLDREKLAPQRLIVDVTMYRPKPTHPAQSLADCMDYARVYEHLTNTWPARPHTELIETLAEDLLAFCFQDASIAACRVRLRKPDIFDGAAVPGLEVLRHRADQPGHAG